MVETDDEYWTKRELAKKWKCSERTIDRLLETGDAPPVTRLSARRIIFPAASAREWLSNRTVGRLSPQGAAVAATHAAPPRGSGRPRKLPEATAE